MKFEIATVCVSTALLLDTASYFRQIKKTIRTKKSSQVSAMAFVYKIAKAVLAMVGLMIYSNYVGMGMEIFMLAVYAVSLAVIVKYKPKGWSLWE